MKTTSIVLAGLFVAQAAVAGVLYYNTSSQRAVRPEGALLALDADALQQIQIEGDNESVVLKNNDGTWLIGDTGLPAEPFTVEQTVKALTDMQLGWAVANTAASHQQLEVADDNYQRRVSISSGDDSAEILVGTSPGFKRSHVRKEGADEVYSVAINTYDLPTNTTDWLDKSLLQIEGVSSVTLNGEALVQQDEQWVFGDSDNTDQTKAAELVSALEGLRVTGVAENPSDDIAFETVAVKAGDAEYEYRFAAVNDEYLVGRQDIDALFSLSQSAYDSVIGVELLVSESVDDAPSSDEPGSANESDQAD
jgi:hypothetical protein